MNLREEISHAAAGVNYRHVIVRPAADGPHPAVLIFPQWSGRSPEEEKQAGRLADLGYVGIACDLYGEGRRGSSQDENQKLMQPLLDDRAELRARLLGVLEAMSGVEGIDAGRMAACGYCFGGLCAIDLARAGAGVKGIGSFHGLLGAPEELDEPEIMASIAIYHGWADPMAPPAHVEALAAELTRRGADWYLMGFGHAVHAFTRADAGNDRASGIAYDAAADKRSWRGFTGFLQEIL